jgi:peptidoglycan glycosyltransferase
MTRAGRIWHLINAGLLLLVLLTARLGYWHVARGRELQPVALDPVVAAAQYSGSDDPDAPVTLETLPQPVIQRTVIALQGLNRGTIFDRNGQPLAYTETDAAGDRVRRYTDPSLAHVVGYVSGLGTGVNGLERSFNLSLLGIDRLDSRVSQTLHQPVEGSDLYLTIDSRLQRVAAEALGDRRGAVVVLNAHTGAVLAMTSAPTFDPNRILDQDYMTALAQGCGGGCPGVLLNRATQGLYTPGSTWKTVTLIAALDTGHAEPGTVFDFGPPVQTPNGSYYVYSVDGGIITDPNHPERVLDLTGSYAASANAAFARLGDELGGETMLDYAARLGFSRPQGIPPIEIDASASQVANDPATMIDNNLLRASAAIGQGEVLATPLQMALVVAGVVNNGDVPRPHLVESVRHPNGRVLSGEPRGNWLNNTMRGATAAQVREMMVNNIRSGKPASAAVPGATAGGKTGTAQLGGTLAPHAWYVGFADDGEHAVAVAVVIENIGSGSSVAAPVFSQMAAAALRFLNEPVVGS